MSEIISDNNPLRIVYQKLSTYLKLLSYSIHLSEILGVDHRKRDVLFKPFCDCFLGNLTFWVEP
jgi:hypothetical protein